MYDRQHLTQSRPTCLQACAPAGVIPTLPTGVRPSRWCWSSRCCLARWRCQQQPIPIRMPRDMAMMRVTHIMMKAARQMKTSCELARQAGDMGRR